MRSNLRKKRGCLKNHFETPTRSIPARRRRSAQQTAFAPIKKRHAWLKKTNSQSSEAIASLRGGATERVRDDFFMQSIKKSSRTCAVRDDMVREMRLELTRLLPHAPQTCLSAYSSTLAFIRFLSVSQLNNQDYIIRYSTCQYIFESFFNFLT